MPTIAVLVLRAPPLAVSALFAVAYGAQAASVPFAGVLVDSVRSLRRLLIVVDLLQVLVVGSVPVSRALSLLSLPVLFGVAALSGGLGGLTGIAIRAFAARGVAPADVLAGNAVITGARTAGQVPGPALAGWLIQALGVVTAVAADAASYLLSALICLRLPVAAAGPAGRAGRGLRADRRSLREGLAVLAGSPALIRLTVADSALNLGGAAIGSLYVLYAFRILGLKPGALGTVLVVQNAAALLAVATATRVSRRIGLERVVPVFAPAAAAALLLIPAASWLAPLAVLGCYGAIFGYCTTVWAIGSVSLEQLLVPPGQIGRVIALSRVVSLVVIPAGALGGGALADLWGTRPTLLAAALAALAGTLTVAGRPSTWRPGTREGGLADPKA
jgi:predicted MFS family arabinose efflux permease